MRERSVTYSERNETTFQALADPTRRAVLDLLRRGSQPAGRIASTFPVSRPAISKHLKVLERAGLISSGRDAQRRPRRIEAAPLAEATRYLERYRELWEPNFQRLDALLEELQTTAKKPQRAKRRRNPL